MRCKAAEEQLGGTHATKVLAWSVYPNCLIWLLLGSGCQPAGVSRAIRMGGCSQRRTVALNGAHGESQARLVVNASAEEISDEKVS